MTIKAKIDSKAKNPKKPWERRSCKKGHNQKTSTPEIRAMMINLIIGIIEPIFSRGWGLFPEALVFFKIFPFSGKTRHSDTTGEVHLQVLQALLK
jgi:hypothetical protein